MKVYLKVNPNTHVIDDCIEFPYGDYIEVEIDYIPRSINGGWFKYENGEVVEYPELKPVSRDEEIEKLKTRLDFTEEALLGLLLGGM